MPNSWSTNAACGSWKCCADAVHKKNRPVCLRHAGVHQGTIPVPFDVSFETLVRTVPSHLACAVAGARPVRETFKVLSDRYCDLVADEVDERISQANFGLEVDWQVHEVISS